MRSHQSAAAQPRGGSGVRFRTPERPVDRPARGLSPDLCVVGKDAPQRPARGLTNKGGKQVGRRLPGGSAASQARPSRSSQITPSQEKVGHDQALTPDRVSTLLQSLGIAADSVLVDRVLHEIRHASAGADRGESQTQTAAAAQAVVESAEDSARIRAPRLPAASADSRGRVPGLLEEVLGDFQGELDDFRPAPAATSPLRSPEALLAKLRAVRLKRGLGIAELQALGDVNGDGRLTAVELGKVFAAVGINADEELVYEVWRHIDTNHNGQVSLFELFQAMKPSTTEVLTALSHVKYRRHASLSTLFRPYDSNGDDKLTPAEFHRMLNDLGFELDDEGVRDLLQVIVRDRDGGNLLSLRDLTLALESLERQAGRPDLRMGGSSKASAVESTLPRSPDRLVMDSPKRSPERPMTAPPPGTEAVPSQESQAQKASKLAELQNPVVPFKHAIKRLDPCGLPLGAQAWESLNRIFYRLAQQSKEVSTKELILAIRSDVRIKTEGLLHRPVIATDDGGPAVSLDEALHQVETQVLDGIGHLEMVSWDRFYWLLLEAHRHRAARHLLPVPLRPESPPNPAVKTSPVSLMNCPVDPNESPAASIQWLAQDCCCNEEMLYRLYEKFTYCCGGDLVHVPRERFLQAVQNSENLYAALTTTPLLSGRPVVVKPMNWGDVLWQLSRREASLLSWSDIVATVCWCRAWSLGLSESETLHVSPRVRPSSASAAKARVEALLQNRAADATDNRAKPSPLQPSFAVPQITRMQDMQSRSPLETVSRRLAEASGSGFETRTQRSKHPWLDDSDDDVPSRVSVSRVPAPEVPRLSNEASHSRHSHGKSQGQAPVALRLQMPEGRPPPDPKELQRLELELARILNMPVQAVKLQGLRP